VGHRNALIWFDRFYILIYSLPPTNHTHHITTSYLHIFHQHVQWLPVQTLTTLSRIPNKSSTTIAPHSTTTTTLLLLHTTSFRLNQNYTTLLQRTRQITLHKGPALNLNHTYKYPNKIKWKSNLPCQTRLAPSNQ